MLLPTLIFIPMILSRTEDGCDESSRNGFVVKEENGDKNADLLHNGKCCKLIDHFMCKFISDI